MQTIGVAFWALVLSWAFISQLADGSYGMALFILPFMLAFILPLKYIERIGRALRLRR